MTVSLEDFIVRSEVHHGTFFDYSFVNFSKVKDRVTIICPSHGFFNQVARDHMRGVGCRECFFETRRMSFEKFKDRALTIHGDSYSYIEDGFSDSRNAIIVCQSHGEFIQDKNRHLNGADCLKCSRENSRMNFEKFFEGATSAHGDLYDYSYTVVNRSTDKIKVRCRVHDFFEVFVSNHLSGVGCPNCRVSNKSKGELELSSFVESTGFSIICNDRKILKGLELDIVIPELKIAIEYNGDYWHSDEVIQKTRGVSSKTFHKLKMTLALESGYRLYFIWESDWISFNEEVKDSLLNLFKDGFADSILTKLSVEST